MGPGTEQKQAIVRDKIAVWENTYYSCTLDVKVGQDTDDDPMVTRAQDQMKKCLRAVQVFETILTELENEPASE